MSLYAAFHKYSAEFDVEADGDPIVRTSSSLQPVWVYQGGGPGYHDYALVYHRATGLASLVVDGVERVNDISGDYGWGPWGVVWGSPQQGPYYSIAHWSALTVAVVPEPGVRAVLALGLGLLAARRLPKP